MTLHPDDVPLADLVEQERELDETPWPEPGDPLPDRPLALDRVDVPEADVLEQAQVVRGDDDEYPFGTQQAAEEA